jgi:hypothetical protein
MKVRRQCLLFALLICAVWLVPRAANAQLFIHPKAAITLGGVAAPGQQIPMVRLGSGGTFVVPEGKTLVLTDVVVSPQVVPSAGAYAWQITSSAGTLTNVNVTSSAEDPSSFQLHLTTGMIFQAGSRVRFHLIFGATSVNLSAFGYLATVGKK